MKIIQFDGKAYAVAESVSNFVVFRKPSSNVEFFGHDKEHDLMFFQFKHGAYLYTGVPAEVAEKAETSESIGKFFASEIKGKYECVKADGKLVREEE